MKSSLSANYIYATQKLLRYNNFIYLFILGVKGGGATVCSCLVRYVQY